MFKVKIIDEEYIVYEAKFDEDINSTLFLIYRYGGWHWIDSSLCEPIIDKGK